MKNDTSTVAAMYGDAISMRVDQVVLYCTVRERDARITFLTCCAHATYLMPLLCCARHTPLTLHAGSTDFYRVCVHGLVLVLVHEKRRTQVLSAKCQVHELLPFLHPAATTSFVWFPRILFVHWPR